MLKNLVELANRYDRQGKYKVADRIDFLLKQALENEEELPITMEPPAQPLHVKFDKIADEVASLLAYQTWFDIQEPQIVAKDIDFLVHQLIKKMMNYLHQHKIEYNSEDVQHMVKRAAKRIMQKQLLEPDKFEHLLLQAIKKI